VAKGVGFLKKDFFGKRLAYTMPLKNRPEFQSLPDNGSRFLRGLITILSFKISYKKSLRVALLFGM